MTPLGIPVQGEPVEIAATEGPPRFVTFRKRGDVGAGSMAAANVDKPAKRQRIRKRHVEDFPKSYQAAWDRLVREGWAEPQQPDVARDLGISSRALRENIAHYGLTWPPRRA
jgi:hypothetical protein